MPQIHNICSHIQNSFRSRLPRISVPATRMNLALARVLYEQGFIASVARGNRKGPDEAYVPTTNLNIASRRYWLELKYRQNEPVLTSMQVISKPSRRITGTLSVLKNLIAGKRQGLVKPVLPGEIVMVATCYGVLEINEAVRRHVGGELLCRAR
ncbi:30S ribosomal protein S8 [Dimargaris cristalligena]|uniref:30S ribosomal protein S8 n=1 Tax=Dimargaris cristalligena TaxID=215637 RepID=A0A4P9ZPA2_9FUNG|nr:30S ribosomal protein S8 [Dimargaris cristalligena]|eukprot:RKP35137.1 30S ribosomal protein S8 [Dimargaris cristalligena]